MSKHFVPVVDVETPRSERRDNSEEFRKHRQFDNPHTVRFAWKVPTPHLFAQPLCVIWVFFASLSFERMKPSGINTCLPAHLDLCSDLFPFDSSCLEEANPVRAAKHGRPRAFTVEPAPTGRPSELAHGRWFEMKTASGFLQKNLSVDRRKLQRKQRRWPQNSKLRTTPRQRPLLRARTTK